MNALHSVGHNCSDALLEAFGHTIFTLSIIDMQYVAKGHGKLLRCSGHAPENLNHHVLQYEAGIKAGK